MSVQSRKSDPTTVQMFYCSVACFLGRRSSLLLFVSGIFAERNSHWYDCVHRVHQHTFYNVASTFLLNIKLLKPTSQTSLACTSIIHIFEMQTFRRLIQKILSLVCVMYEMETFTICSWKMGISHTDIQTRASFCLIFIVNQKYSILTN